MNTGQGACTGIGSCAAMTVPSVTLLNNKRSLIVCQLRKISGQVKIDNDQPMASASGSEC